MGNRRRLLALCLLGMLCVTGAWGDGWEENAGEQPHDCAYWNEECQHHGFYSSEEDGGTGEPRKEADPEEESLEEQDPIYRLIYSNGLPSQVDEGENERLLAELKEENPEKAALWREIITYMNRANTPGFVRGSALPDNLRQDDGLCLVVLGFELNADGSMKPELVKRLEVARQNLERYPNALVLVTGGGTASKNRSVTEADQMAAWLRDNGVEGSRVIVENRSYSTLGNAVNSIRILEKSYPQVEELALITSDYHIPWGSVTFYGEIASHARLEGGKRYNLVSNASCAMGGDLHLSIQRAQLWELAKRY